MQKLNMRNFRIKEAQTDFFNFIWNILYHKKAHIFLITHGKFHGWKVFHLEDIDVNVPGYGLFYNQGTSSVSFLVKNEMFCNSTTCFLLCYE